MKLPTDVRALFAFGILCIVVGAGLTFAIVSRTQRLRGAAKPDLIAATDKGPERAQLHSPPRGAKPLLTPHAAHASTDLARGQRKGGAPRREPVAALPEARQERVATARRELELLEVQKPESFLAIFDMMKQEARWNDKTLQDARAASHGYILARTRVLERMLRRFIDDPEAEHGLEIEALARLDDEFKQKTDALARDIPAVANLQEILVTTSLKAPTFAVPDPDSDSEVADFPP